MPSQEELDAIGRKIDEYNTYVVGFFPNKLKELLQEAQEQKNKEPKSEATRHWAVVYTELEKVSAYVNTYIKE